MSEKRQKKIRNHLINFMNQELLRNKKNKQSRFLINSMTFEKLEEKNLQCKNFYVKEKDQIYQNIDNGWIIGLNIYINNLYNNNPYIYSLSNLIKDNYIINNIKNKNDFINRVDNINNDKETIIQKISNKILYIQKEGNMGSPVDTSLLIKKELGERKLKRSINEYNSNKIPACHSDRFLIKEKIENSKVNFKENEKSKETNNLIHNISNNNDIEDINKLQKQLSKETLETEISRIIRICHDEKYTNSFEHFPSDSKISRYSKEIKIAKIYAKKLKLYCRTLKRKFPLNTDNKINNSSDQNDLRLIYEEKDDKINKQNIYKKKINSIEEKKEKSKKIKRISSLRKNTEKIKEENNMLDNIKSSVNHKHIIQLKKLKSEKNIEFKIKRNSFLKIIKEIDNTKLNNNKYRTLEDKDNKKKTNTVKISKKRNKKSLDSALIPKSKFKIKKELIKSSPKIINNLIRNDIKKSSKNHKTMNDIYIITDSPKLSIINISKKNKKKGSFKERRKNKISTEANKEYNSKKIIKFRKKFEDILKKKHLDMNKMKNNNKKRASIDKSKKRASVDAKVNLSGFEKLNFLKTKTKSTQEQFSSNGKKKTINIKSNNIINNDKNNMSRRKDSSISIEKNKKHKKSNNRGKKLIQTGRNPKDEKKKTFGFLKPKRASVVIETLKKMQKRRSTNLYDVNIMDNKIFSPIYKEEKNIDNNTISDSNKKIEKNTKKHKIKTVKNLKELNHNKKSKETDIFNIMDEFLYKKKHERRKNVIN